MTSTLGHGGSHHAYSQADLNLLALLTEDRGGPGSPTAGASGSGSGSPSTSTGSSSAGAAGPAHDHSHPHRAGQAVKRKEVSDRRPPVDPLMVAAASAAGPE